MGSNRLHLSNQFHLYWSSFSNYKLHLLWPPMDFPNILLARVCISDLHLQWPLMGSNGLHLSYCLHMYSSSFFNYKHHLLWPPMDFPNILLARICISDLHLQWPLMGSNELHLSCCLHLHWSSSSTHKLHLLWPLNLQWLFVPVPRKGFASTGPRSYVAYIDINAPHWGTSPLN